jgi:predicted DsbA family dithiol-disulfide isomerase
MRKLRIDVWSDIACPWCYVGKRHLETALERFPHRDDVEVVWRAFELDPSAPREREQTSSYADRLAKKYGTSAHEAQGRIDRMIEIARADGLVFDFVRIRPGNTFDAHRILHLAHERGVQDAVKERFLLGYMSEGEPIGSPDALLRMASEAGLDADTVRATLATDDYTREVRQDEAEAHELGIQGVPFFVLGGRYAISGAQPAELLLQGIQQAWSEVEAKPIALGEGAACGPEGCDV